MLTYLKWTSTVLLIVGALLSSLNAYPANVVAGLIGNLGWAWCGYKMKEPSLWSVSLILCVIYTYGSLHSF